MWSRLCGGLPSRQYEEEDLVEVTMPLPVASLPVKSDACQSPAEAVTSGTLVPDNTFVGLPTNVLQDPQAELPWNSLRDLIQAVWQRRRRLRLGFTRKDRHLIQQTNPLPSEDDKEVNVPPHRSNKIQPESSKSLEQDQVDRIEGRRLGSNVPPSPSIPVSMTDLLDQGNSVLNINAERRNAGLEAVLLAEGKSTVESKLVSGSMPTNAGPSSAVRITDSSDRAHIEPEADLFLDNHPVAASEQRMGTNSETEIMQSSVQHPKAPSRQDSDDWCTFAGMIKDAAGESRAEKLFYDTGSPDSWVSQKLIDKYKIPTRPILPENLKEYYTMGNELVIPHDYAEIELKDDHNGIHQFKMVSFNITKSMGGRGLLLGRAFMFDNAVKLDPKEGLGVYVFTAREASDGKAQAHLLQYF